jgi:NAD+ kinase
LQILSLNVYVNGEFLNNYHADGIIVATPTGSTGYSMSAGGPIVDPKGDMILLTPNNAHNLTSKSIVLSGDDEIEIEILSRREQNDEMACVSYDGDTTAELAVGDRFVISKAANHTKICKLHQRSFLEILRKKMGNYS